MSPVGAVREFVNRRLCTAAEEIFSAFQPTFVKYEEQIQTLQHLLQLSRSKTTKTQRTDEPQLHFCKEEQLCNKQQQFILGPDGPEPPQIKKELLGGNQFADTRMMNVVGQCEPRDNLESLNSVREFINQRLTAAAGEIYTEFQTTIIQYQEEIQSQQRLLEITLNPQIKLHRIDGPEEKVNISLENNKGEAPQIKDQEEPEVSRIKEETEFYSTCDEQPVLKHEVDHFMIPTSEQSQLDEPEADSELPPIQDSVGAESQQQKVIGLLDLGSMKKVGLKSKERCHSKNVINAPLTPQRVKKQVASRKTHTAKKLHACDLCGKFFRTPSELLCHTKIHTGEKPHSCETCGKRFRLKSDLLVHTRVHTGEKPFSCVTCSKCFSQRSDMLVHMRTHSGEKPFSCEICGKSFTQRRYALLHMRIHNGEKPHFCLTCDKSFRQSSSLLRHMRLHSGEKPHSCITCCKSFIQRCSLLRHMRTHI